MRSVTLLFVLLAATWSGLAAWTFFENRAACRRCVGTRADRKKHLRGH